MQTAKSTFQIGGRHGFPALVILAAIALRCVHPAMAIKTNRVELGHESVYDGKTQLTRNAAGQMLFDDDDLTTYVTLLSLTEGVSAHGELSGLTVDDHAQYLIGSRHDTVHSGDYNSSLTVPLDAGGNRSLGHHLLDRNIHLDRTTDTVEVTGDWTFSGTPSIRAGLTFGEPSDNALIEWDPSQSALSMNRDAMVGGRLSATSVQAWRPSEYALFAMDDNEANSVVADWTGFHPGAFHDTAGDANTDAHTTQGLLGEGLAFDGVDDYINLGPTFMNDMLTTGHDWTLAFWGKYAGGRTEFPVFKDVGSTGIYIIHTATYTKCSFAAAGNSVLLNFNLVPAASWRHFLARREGETVSIWLNGALRDSDTNAAHAGDMSNAQNFYIGRRQASAIYPIKGILDDFRVYGRALSDGEIVALYNNGAGTDAPARVLETIGGALSIDSLGVDGQVTSGVLQVSGGAYCTGSTWVNLSSRREKTDIRPVVSGDKEWKMLDEVEVVEFAYRAPREGNRRQLGFIAEDLREVDPRLSRGNGVAAIDVAAFNTLLLKETKRWIIELEKRLETLEMEEKKANEARRERSTNDPE